MQKQETKLSRQWIASLRSNIKQPIKIVKIHGHAAQETMVDYLIWCGGRSICIEFKTLNDGSTIASKQDDFLKAVVKCGSIGLMIVFTDLENWKDFIVYRRQVNQYFLVYVTEPIELIKQLINDVTLNTTVNPVL